MSTPRDVTHDVPTYDVLIVGAGPGGLATALSAARHGARVLVVDRHPGTSTRPRATGISLRTMEIFRVWGVADAVRERAVPVDHHATSGATSDRIRSPSTPAQRKPNAELKRSPQRSSR